MTIDAMTFDLGGFPSVSLSLVSSDGLAPLPMPLEGSVEKFRQFMDGGAQQQQPDVSRGLAAIAQGLVERPETTDAPVAVERHDAVEVPVVVERHETTDAPVAVERRETIDESQVSRPKSQDFRLASDVSCPTQNARPTPAADVPRETPRVVEAPRVVEMPRAVEIPRVVERRTSLKRRKSSKRRVLSKRRLLSPRSRFLTSLPTLSPLASQRLSSSAARRQKRLW